MKSENVLQCEQCVSENGSFIASELDITYCRKIENSRGRLVCVHREAHVPTDDEGKKTPPATPTTTDDKGDGGKQSPSPVPPTPTTTPDDNGNEEPLDDKGDNVEDENPDDGLPAGSYRGYCECCELKRDGELLACDFCKRDNGSKQYTIAYVSDCQYFVNRDGVLRCDRTQ